MYRSLMRTKIPTLLLILALAALACDVASRTRLLRAQGSPTVYINGYSTRVDSGGKPLVIKGTQVIAFSCADEACYVLSQ
jgi:hypothetical protein